MLRLACSLLLTTACLSSCDKIVSLVAAAAQKGSQRGSAAEASPISSSSKAEVAPAFTAISKASLEHNRVLVQFIQSDKPVNELAYSAGLAHLDRSARKQSGLAKRIIDAITLTRSYEKGLFTPFDTIRRQNKGMPGWTDNAALQRRGYIQIIDQEITTYDSAVAYLERGEEPLMRKNFARQSVPGDVIDEFFRHYHLTGRELAECNLGMFREQRSALQCYRNALTSVTRAQADQHAAEAGKHEQKAKQFEGRMVAEIRKQLGSAGRL